MDGDEREDSEDDCVKEASCPPSAVPVVVSGLKISHTSPDISLEVQAKSEKNHVHTLTRDRVQRQITEPTSSVRSVDLTPRSNCSTLTAFTFTRINLAEFFKAMVQSQNFFLRPIAQKSLYLV